MNKLKIGVLGVSNHFLKRIILPLQNTTHCYIYAIASRDIHKAKNFAKEYKIEKVYKSYQDLLNDKSIDIIYIPLPNHMHAEWTKKAAMAGKHIICEKPITLNSQQAKECIEESIRNDVKIMEAFMYKFHPQWIHAKNIIKTNQIGNIKYINAAFAYNNPQPTNIRNIKEYGGGAIMDIGCYAISASRFLLNSEPIRVFSFLDKHETFKTDILSSAILDFGVCRATFNVATLTQANQYVQVVGTSGMITIPVPFNTYVDTESEIIITTTQGERTVRFDICDQYGLMFDSFAKSLINNSEPPYSTLDALNNMKVIDAVFNSAISEKWEIIA